MNIFNSVNFDNQIIIRKFNLIVLPLLHKNKKKNNGCTNTMVTHTMATLVQKYHKYNEGGEKIRSNNKK